MLRLPTPFRIWLGEVRLVAVMVNICDPWNSLSVQCLWWYQARIIRVWSRWWALQWRSTEMLMRNVRMGRVTSYYRGASGSLDCHWELWRGRDKRTPTFLLFWWISVTTVSALQVFPSDSPLWSGGSTNTSWTIHVPLQSWVMVTGGGGGEQSVQHRHFSTSSSQTMSTSTTDVSLPLHLSCRRETF